MIDLLVHPKTLEKVANFTQKPSHALLISGPAGSGKLSLAIDIAETVLQIDQGNFRSHNYTKIISSVDNKIIGIDTIREIDQFLSLKVPNSDKYNRAIIVDNSHMLSVEAQNALLKLLEEPPDGTIIILTVDHNQSLLPTIRSRAQKIHLSTPSDSQTKQYFLNNFTEKNIKQAYSISGGLPGLMSAILSDQEHPLTEATIVARELLTQDTFQRLLAVDKLSKDNQLAQNVVFILKQMSHVSLQTASGKTAQKWQGILTASYEAGEGLTGNANSKLLLTKLMLSL